MSDLIANSIWLLGSLAILAIIGTSALAVGKLGRLLIGRQVEIDSIFYLVGAFVGMLFLPSGDHPTAESRVALVFALACGAFLGGLAGLFAEAWLSRSKASSRSSAVKQPYDGRKFLPTILAGAGRLTLVVLVLVAGAIVIVLRLGDVPFLSPIAHFLRHLL